MEASPIEIAVALLVLGAVLLVIGGAIYTIKK